MQLILVNATKTKLSEKWQPRETYLHSNIYFVYEIFSESLFAVKIFSESLFAVNIFSESLFAVSQSDTFAVSQSDTFAISRATEFCNFSKLLSLWTKTVWSVKSMVFIT